MGDAQPRAQAEIERIHAAFVEWFRGRCPPGMSEYAARFDAIADGFTLVTPDGTVLSKRELATQLGGAHGSNPDFVIEVRDVTVRRQEGDLLLVTYEEHQRGARHTDPSDNRRLSSALLRDRGDRFEWLHVHETWLA